MEGLDWCLVLGTCLGAVREGDLIEYDFDIDVALDKKHADEMDRIAKCLTSKGCSASVIPWTTKKGKTKFIQNYYMKVPGHIMLRNLGDKFETRKVQGVDFPVPVNPEKYLEAVYGKWKVPLTVRQWNREKKRKKWDKNKWGV